MKQSVVLQLVFLFTVPLSAQENRNHEPVRPEYPIIPHLNIIRASETPGAVPLHEVALTTLFGRYGQEFAGGISASQRFSDDYGVDSGLAATMVAAVRQVQAELAASQLIRTREFCSRSFANQDAWLAAVIAFDAASTGDRTAAFDKLRDVAGVEAWEKILLQAHTAARAATIVQEDYASVANDIGYEKAFSNQCTSVREE